MGKYKFYQDRKVTSWERDYFSVKANSYECNNRTRLLPL